MAELHSDPPLHPSDELILILQESYRGERTQPKLHPVFSDPAKALAWIEKHTTRYAGLF